MQELTLSFLAIHASRENIKSARHTKTPLHAFEQQDLPPELRIHCLKALNPGYDQAIASQDAFWVYLPSVKIF